ncbi:MAG: bifunctional 5,10-methylenetetrahydrofolate dehydrogenase/5,10-methenyltetrahydrofolate cyclohydrolase [Isosphaeraceae bacterium]
MSARILDGKVLAGKVRAEVAAGVATLQAETGVTPGLAVVLVGDNPASQVYVRGKESASTAAGIRSTVLRLPAETSQAAIVEAVELLNADRAVHGILVQLPLPKGVDERAVLDRVSPFKDVDGFHPENVGRLSLGIPRFVPCTPLGVREILLDAGITTRGVRAVVLGRSAIVGKPMAALLMQKGEGGDATVTVVHTASRDVPGLCREADLLIAAAGQPEFVRGDWIKPGAVVIDVGIHKRPNGKLCGDVQQDEAREVAGWITPVPGGVGPMTIAMLLRNTLQAARLSLGLSS